MTTARSPGFDQEALACEPWLRGYALSLTGNATAAEDLLQETFAKAFAKHDQFAEGTQMRHWLSVVMRNTHYTQWRKRKREVADPEGIRAATLWTPGSQEDVLLLKEVQARLRALPKEMRDCVVLSAIDGLAYEEIAERLSVPIGTVKSRISRARALLEGEDATQEEAPEEPRAVCHDKVKTLFMIGKSIMEIAGDLSAEPGEVFAVVTALGLNDKRKARSVRVAA